MDSRAWSDLSDAHAEVIRIGDGLSIEFQNYVASLDAGFRGRTFRCNGGDKRPAALVKTKGLGHICIDALYRNPEMTSDDSAMVHYLFHYVARHVYGDGKTNSLISSATCDNRCVIS